MAREKAWPTKVLDHHPWKLLLHQKALMYRWGIRDWSKEEYKHGPMGTMGKGAMTLPFGDKMRSFGCKIIVVGA